MCDIWKTTDNQSITLEEFERHLKDIEELQVEWVVFSGGEPLMHPDLFRLAGMLRSRRIKVTILSTGLLLERHAAEIVGNVDDVIVSLDGPPAVHDAIRGMPGAFERMRAGVRAVHGLASGFPIASRCTVQQGNAGHLVATVEAARELGLRSISFLAADLTSTAFNRPVAWPEPRQSGIAPELAVLEQEIARLPEDGFVVESREKLARIVAHFRAHYGWEEPVAPRCNAPWVSAVVEANGDVRPCFFHPAIGNLGSTTLREVLNGPLAENFRTSLNVSENTICRRCTCSLWRDLS
jgi:MoaA/NifB/PqqE/SkfB family radical SAM enzyme